MARNQRIKDALTAKRISQQTLADKLKITQAAVAKQLSKPTDIDSMEFIDAVAELTGLSREYLIDGEPDPKGEPRSVIIVEEPGGHRKYKTEGAGEIEYQKALHKFNETWGSYHRQVSDEHLSGKTIRPLTITVDRSGNELITYVPVKAQAGYRRGYGDPQYIQQLPAFSLPILISQSATHRMFQVDGNSMRQIGGGGLNDGDVVIAAYVEDVLSIKDNRVYVFVTTDGLLIKRIFNRLTTPDKVLVLNSDNKSGEYGPIILHPHEILEVWEYKAHISKQLPFSVDLWEALTELQAKQSILEDQVKAITQEKELKKIKGQ